MLINPTSTIIIKVVNIVPIPAVLASMYRTGMYTSIKKSTFRTGLNTGCIGYILVIPANIGQYRPVLGISAGIEKSFFFFKVL